MEYYLKTSIKDKEQNVLVVGFEKDAPGRLLVLRLCEFDFGGAGHDLLKDLIGSLIDDGFFHTRRCCFVGDFERLG